MSKIDVKEYTDGLGNSPFRKYLLKLQDVAGRNKIVSAIRRIQAQEHFGDTAPVGEGVSELRIHGGPGYRVYYGKDGDKVVILLCAGDKDSQQRDIARAKDYWKDHKASKKTSRAS